ncbi:MAG: FAD-binding oxidoreductase [Alphaproteobacteria bacterium]|nr:FAD-binding oxidoreductase [Alphaproteobacteria bacterium]
MKRRTLLQHAAAIPLLGSSLAYSRVPTNLAKAPGGPPGHRIRPGDPAWPSAAEWDGLKQAVGGRLLKVESPLMACVGASDSLPCHDLLKALRNPFFIGGQPGATESTGWADAWMFAPSVYAVAAKSAGEVAAAVNFAREHNLRLVVKGGGHSYLGTSNAPDSLLVWTKAMDDIVLHDDFVPQGCAARSQAAVSVGAGAIWLHVYNAVTTQAGRYVQGGGCTTVGVAGLIQSGGFGSFSKNYGTAAASLLEAEVVTADGEVRIANPCRDPELFWALKGGGGGSFGIITRVTLKTHDLADWAGGVFFSVKAMSGVAYRDLILAFVRFYAEQLFNPHWGESINLRRDDTLSLSMVSRGLDKAAAQAVWQPFLDWIAASPQDYRVSGQPNIFALPARSLWDAAYLKAHSPNAIISDSRPGAAPGDFSWAGDHDQIGAFWHGYESLWLPASLLQPDRQKHLADALFAASRHWTTGLHFNKGLAGAPPEVIVASRDTATNPAVLEAFALAIIGGYGPPAYPGIPGHEPDLTEARNDAAAIGNAMEELRRLGLARASYVSESNYFEKFWQQSYWGANYPRLKAAKAQYDPDGLFFVHHGVGSEEWSADGFERFTAN